LAVSLAALDLGASQGAAVLGLLERAQVAPVPALYSLLFDYVSGVRGLFASRVDDIIGEGGDVGGRLYAEFVAPYESTEAVERALARMVERLSTLDALVVHSVSAAQMQSAALKGATAELAAPRLDSTLLRDWVERLAETNRGMRRANVALERELVEAATELQLTRDEINRSKESMACDPLTGVANRAGLDAALQRALLACGQRKSDLSCAVVDIDHFKSLNDRYGHQVGDEVLRVVARALLVSVRGGDVVGRPGGDEFLVVLPDANLDQAQELAERMRASIAESDLAGVVGEAVLGGITASIGVALYQENDSIGRFVERADRCLYQAKAGGRNRVVVDRAALAA